MTQVDESHMADVHPCYPKLRAVDMRPTVQAGRPGILLRDPLQLSDKTLVIPQPLHMVLPLCDGTREDAGALSASLAVRHGLRLAPGVIEQLLHALDEALFLDNDTFARAYEQALAEYRQADFRFPASAGASYPFAPDALKRLLDGYLDGAVRSPDGAQEPREIRGLVSPHIDYARGGPVYAGVWQQAAAAARAADLVVILGTDHSGHGSWLTLTRQHYATPFGILPTDRDVVDALAGAVGEQAAFAGELNHRREHSVELAAVWLHHVRGGEPCQVVPILCGPLPPSGPEDTGSVDDLPVVALLSAFRAATAGRRTLIVAAADLAHVGPAFGGPPVDFAGRARLAVADETLIARMCAGDAAGFLAEIEQVGNRNNVCGVPPIYLALRLLHPARGELAAYDRCPADGQGTSLVSVCGIVFS